MCFTKQLLLCSVVMGQKFLNWPLLKDYSRELNLLSLTFSKPIVMILLWHLSTSLFYYTIVHPTSAIQLGTVKWTLFVIAGILLSSFFSPLAGYLADAKFGRYRLLTFSTVLMIGSISISLVVAVLLKIVFHSFSVYYVLLTCLFLFGVLTYCCGNVIFRANILQFGTDQLRDSPTMCSTLFLLAFLWCSSFSNTLALTTNLPGHEFFIHLASGVVFIDNLKMALVIALSGISVICSFAILLALRKWKHLFSLEMIGSSPYRVVSEVLLFALRHKKPIRRSAFTFCESKAPSRIDFAKRRYGGPFTTEQVEDVKVMCNIIKVMLALGPVFLMEQSASLSVIKHHNQPDFNASNPVQMLFLDYGVLYPFSIVVILLLYNFLLKPVISKCVVLNMFKRIGLSAVLLNVSVLLILLHGITANDGSSDLGTLYEKCSTAANSSSLLKTKLLHVPIEFLKTLLYLLMSVSRILLFVGSQEFICCQSPQHMKGFLFGIFLATKSFFQFLSIAITYCIIMTWNSELLDCRTGGAVVTLCIGIVGLVLFLLSVRKYEYRKRDDICNVHLFAEEYYTKYGSTASENS